MVKLHLTQNNPPQNCLPAVSIRPSSPNPPPGWARRPCVCGGRALGKGDKKQLENMQGSPKGC
ncbi:MAG: hypothetical protein RBR87_15605 [Bacteroidales bacterium]|nr:hypothetical protein [Bacteroidales bacterium]